MYLEKSHSPSMTIHSSEAWYHWTVYMVNVSQVASNLVPHCTPPLIAFNKGIPCSTSPPAVLAIGDPYSNFMALLLILCLCLKYTYAHIYFFNRPGHL